MATTRSFYIVDTKQARSTGAFTSVLNLQAPDREVEAVDGFYWAAECHEHGWIIWTKTRREAHREAASPEDWCEGCAELA